MERCREALGVVVALSLGALGACGRSVTDTTIAGSATGGTATADPSPSSPDSSSAPGAAPATGPKTPRTTPRLIAPMSSSISTSMRPLFTWEGESATAAATIDVCRDRACQNVITSFTATGSSARPAQPLPPGVVFWRVTGTQTAGRTSAVWELTIPARESGRTGNWGSVPDFNSDGFADLAVGVAPYISNGVPPINQMRIFPGGPQGPSTAPAQTFSGPFGFANGAGSAGDLDGDGFADLAIWNAPTTLVDRLLPATVTVYRGGPQGLSSPVTIDAPEVIGGTQMRVLSAGDVNGDGYGDLLVGGANAAALFLGGPTGVSATPAQTLPPAPSTPPDARWPVGNGDLNGDGHPDADISGVSGGMLYEGDGQGLVAHPETPLPNAFSGLAGDFNGDGFADLASYAVITGGPNGPTTQFEVLAGQYFYQGVGDVNGDGFSDVLNMVSSLVGVPEAERLYFGMATGCNGRNCTNFVPLFVPGHQNDGNPQVAIDARGIGDVNGDGFSDFVYLSPGAGAVYLFLGSPAGPPSNPSRTITAEPGFGFSVAGM